MPIEVSKGLKRL